MPHAMLVDSVIPQQRAAHELQVRLHGRLPEIDSLGTFNRAELRNGILVQRRTQTVRGRRGRSGGRMNKRIPCLPKVCAQGRCGHARLNIRVSVAAVRRSWTRRGLSRYRHCPASDECILHRFDLRDGAIITIGTSRRGCCNLLNESNEP